MTPPETPVRKSSWVMPALIGFLLGAVAASLALFQAERRVGCFDRCGEGTSCRAGRCVLTMAAPAPGPPPIPAADRRRKRGRATGGEAASEPLATIAPELQLQAGDETPATQGDALGRTESIDLTSGEEAAHELGVEEVERVFAPARAAVSGCISRAVGDYPLSAATVEVGFRVERGGRVERVRVTAPALLQKQGLYRCVRPLVAALRFPASGGASVVTFPFQLK
jgi:hypothetical protein